MAPLTSDQQRNIQGVGLAGFRKDTQELMFLRFGDAASARSLLAKLEPYMATFAEVSQFNAAFSEILQRTGREDVVEATWVGLLIGPRGYGKLGVNLGELPAGPATDAFTAGMAARAGAIGHTRPNDAPTGWIAEFRSDQGIDALVIVAADDTDDLDERVTEIENLVSAAGCEIAFQERSATLPGALKGHEHFGFKDGISQPAIIDLDPAPQPNEPPAIQLGELVLGYPDQTGNAAAVGNLWQDGSFAAFERIAQNVPAFRQQAQNLGGGANPPLSADQMAAKTMGRWPSGTPLETNPDADPGDTGVTNAFQYQAAPFGDDDGSKTPRFAHIRKANPRDETRPAGDDPVERHRMIRRGAPFGPPLPSSATTDDGVPRGLHFLCIVADLARQFEFVRARWMSDANFPSGGTPATPGGPYTPPQPGTLADGPDPVVGEHDDTGVEVALHQPSGVHGLALGPEVVSVTAGEYFFVPSLTAIAKLAAGATTSG
jgi:Dyp-type peroxidase family